MDLKHQINIKSIIRIIYSHNKNRLTEPGNGLVKRFLMELEMGPFPTELRKVNGTVSLQPRGARDGDIALATLIDKQTGT